MSDKMNTNKKIQVQRVMRYFTEAAYEILLQEGADMITIRKVADKAGYNSATIYNYFDNLEHLVYFAYMKAFKDYLKKLPEVTQHAKNAADRFFKVWHHFCQSSFQKPIIYYTLFYATDIINKQNYFRHYYEIYPEDIKEIADIINPAMLRMVTSFDILERGNELLEDCVGENFIRTEDVPELNDRIYLIYEGLLMRVIRKESTPESAMHKADVYFKHLFQSYSIQPVE